MVVGGSPPVRVGRRQAIARKAAHLMGCFFCGVFCWRGLLVVMLVVMLVVWNWVCRKMLVREIGEDRRLNGLVRRARLRLMYGLRWDWWARAKRQTFRNLMTCGSMWSPKWVGQRCYLEMRLRGSTYLRLFCVPSEGRPIRANRVLILAMFFQVMGHFSLLTPFDIFYNAYGGLWASCTHRSPPPAKNISGN